MFSAWCLSAATERLYAAMLQTLDFGKTFDDQGLCVTRESFRNLNARKMGFWYRFSTLLIVVVSTVGSVWRVSPNSAIGDERGRWMISGRVAAGLSSSGSRPATTGIGSEWQAGVSESDWQYIVIHHTATGSGSVESIHAEHRRRKDADGNPWLGIGYHFVVGNGHGMKDGAVESTFRWDEQLHGAHSGHALFNARGIGVCLIGNFEQAPPTKEQMQSVRTLVAVLATRHQIPRERIIGHVAVKATACPGKHFPLNELRQVIPETRR